MAGTIDLTFDDIKDLTIPELSVMVYCTQERMKQAAGQEAGRLYSG